MTVKTSQVFRDWSDSVFYQIVFVIDVAFYTDFVFDSLPWNMTFQAVFFHVSMLWSHFTVHELYAVAWVAVYEQKYENDYRGKYTENSF